MNNHYLYWITCSVILISHRVLQAEATIISPSWGRRKMGNSRGNLCISVGDGVPFHTVWGYLIIFKEQTRKYTNLKNSSDCFGNRVPCPGGGRPVLTPLGHWDMYLALRYIPLVRGKIAELKSTCTKCISLVREGTAETWRKAHTQWSAKSMLFDHSLPNGLLQ